MLIVKMYINIKKSCIIYVVNETVRKRDDIMGRKWNNIKEKRPKKIKTQVEYMRNLVRRFMLQQNLVNPIQNLTKL